MIALEAMFWVVNGVLLTGAAWNLWDALGS